MCLSQIWRFLENNVINNRYNRSVIYQNLTINLYQYNSIKMGSPTKRKFKQGVQQQILTNYYLNKYDRFMSRYTEGQSRTQLPQRQPPANISNNPKRKNFKEAILERKGTNVNNKQREQYKSRSNKKNFRHEVEQKNSKQKVHKQNKKNFYRLQDTIISQLYKPTPSQIEKESYQQIQVVHKVSYGDKVQPFKLVSTEQQENIQIVEQQDEFYADKLKQAKYQVEVQKLQLSKLSNAIKSSFQKRSPNKSRNQSKSPQNKLPPKNQPYPQNFQMSEHHHQQSYFFEVVRPTFESVESRRQTFFQRPQRLQQFQDVQKIKASSSSLMQSDRLSNGNKSYNSLQKAHKNFISRKSSLQKSVTEQVPQKPNRLSISRRSSMSKQINQFKTRNTHGSHDDSFHHNVPQIQRQPKISQMKEKQQNSSEVRSVASSRMRDNSESKQPQSRQSLHELSMLSRFSMTSTEGGQIVDYLQRQLNQNQYGPYQNALTSLLDLIGQYPNAWPIFVVGQRILDDRRQYDAKRNIQQNQINRLQAGIQQIKKGKTNRKLKQAQKNSIQILKLARQLAKKLEQANEPQ